MGYTQYDLSQLYDKERNLNSITKNIGEVIQKFKKIYELIDHSIKVRDNIVEKYSNLNKDMENLVERSYGTKQLISDAITEYTEGEKQINNLVNGLDKIVTLCYTEMPILREDDNKRVCDCNSIFDIFNKIYNFFIYKDGIAHLVNYLKDKRIAVNNSEYKDNKILTNTNNNSILENNFMGIPLNSLDYYNEYRIKTIQEYIKGKGINIEVTGKLDKATFQASCMIGIDELKEIGLIHEENYGQYDMNLYIKIQNNVGILNMNYFRNFINGNEYVSIEDINKFARKKIRKEIDTELIRYRTDLVSIWDRPGITHTMLEGTYGQIYYDFLNGQVKGLETLKLILDLADVTYSGALSYESAMESTGGNMYFAVPLSFVIFAMGRSKDMPGEKPSDINDTFGWCEARNKEIYRTSIKLEYILKSDYRYLINLNGYKKIMLKELVKKRKEIEDKHIIAYREEKYNKIYKNAQLRYINHIIEMNENENKYKDQLHKDLDFIDEYIKKQQYK